MTYELIEVEYVNSPSKKYIYFVLRLVLKKVWKPLWGIDHIFWSIVIWLESFESGGFTRPLLHFLQYLTAEATANLSEIQAEILVFSNSKYEHLLLQYKYEESLFPSFLAYENRRDKYYQFVLLQNIKKF